MDLSRVKRLVTIFAATFKVGMFTFGGGLAMLPMIQREFVDKQKYVTDGEIVDVFAVAQSLPGVISVNASVLIGYKIEKTLGGIMAALGCVLPSFIILSVITMFYAAFIDNIYVKGALKGVSGAVIALFFAALLKLRRQSMSGRFSILLFCGALISALFFKWINVVLLIIAGGILGFVLNIKSLKEDKDVG